MNQEITADQVKTLQSTTMEALEGASLELSDDQKLAVKLEIERLVSSKTHKEVKIKNRDFKRRFKVAMTKSKARIGKAKEWLEGKSLMIMLGAGLVGSVAMTASFLLDVVVGSAAVSSIIALSGAVVFMAPLVVLATYWAMKGVIIMIHEMVKNIKDFATKRKQLVDTFMGYMKDVQSKFKDEAKKVVDSPVTPLQTQPAGANNW